MSPQSSSHPPQPILSRSSSSSRTASFRARVSRHRWLLYFFAGVVILVMAVGLLFVAHKYYMDFGGQGWLKVREESQVQREPHADNLFLPLRKQEVWNSGLQERSPQNNVAFYECGDQQNSCEAYNQPVRKMCASCSYPY
jgi:hypothetical protein